ncbi:hypothetical protein DL98DRAFT_549594 [Cadophora sp. DSE1049]|nr:hypothetical protein DL98DRAFT_549594 [Cadophora sp. DSE1049]
MSIACSCQLLVSLEIHLYNCTHPTCACEFVSFGKVVLDELRFPGKAPLFDVMGGSGAYAKKFKYTTEPLRPPPNDLVASNLLAARCYHFLSKPVEISCQLTHLVELRRLHGINSRPWIFVDMFSPNHLEMMKLFTDEITGDFRPELSEIQAQKFLDHSVGPDGQGYIVIRAAEHGCLSASRASGLCWSPAFYAPGSDVSRVVDPTGAGNAFIEGFAMAMVQDLALDEAVAYSNVAPSFALEQIGAPILKINGLSETWNGEKVMDRLEQYKRQSREE